MRKLFLLFGYSAVLVSLISLCSANSRVREMTFEVPAGKEECFFEEVKAGQILDVDYQVIDGGGGNELEINFKVSKPGGIPMVADFRRSDNTHRTAVDVTGDYRICFDNSLSRYNHKLIFFELIVEDEKGEDEDDVDDYYDQRFLREAHKDTEQYEMKIQDIEQALKTIKERITRTRQFQEQIRVHEFRDRSIAEHNFERVNFWSIVQVTIMIFAGAIQVVLVRSLFDEKSALHNFWKRLC